MPRFLLPPDMWDAPAPALTGDEARHLTQVLRVRTGDEITLFDGCGRRANAEVLDVTRDHVGIRIKSVRTPAPPKPRITLVQAIPKGKTMDLIVRKSVELGVAAITPLVTRNTVVKPGDGKAGKWRRAALEACKQCGQDTLPTVAETATFDNWLATLPPPPPDQPRGFQSAWNACSGVSISAEAHEKAQVSPVVVSPSAAHSPIELRIIASLAPGAEPLRNILHAHPHAESAILLIGPEGDFSPEETESALVAGFLPATLGSIVLRVETASLYCLSALRYEYGSGCGLQPPCPGQHG